MEPPKDEKYKFISLESFLKLAFPLMIVLGVINLTSYYNQFKLPVLNYLTFTEIITLFLENIVYYLFLLLPAFLLLALRYGHNSNLVLWAVGCLFLVVSAIVLLNENSTFGNWKIYVVLLLLIVYLPTFFLIKLIRKESKIENNNIQKYLYLWAILFFVGSLLNTSVIGAMNAADVKNHHIYSGTEIDVESRTIISNDTIYFIGKTENFIFLYDELKGGPIIYPIDKVDRVFLKFKRTQRGEIRPRKAPLVP